MEKLKKFEEICEPDSRQKYFVTRDNFGNFWQFTLERLYNDLKDISLHEGVPENLQNHFQMARNLYLYSWFYYPFNISAQLYGFISVEFALRERLGDKSPIVVTPEGLKEYKKREKEEKRRSFARWIEMAVEQKLLSDKGFSFANADYFYGLSQNLREEIREDNPDPYCTLLKIAIPYFRNECAHGSSMLNAQAAIMLKICAEFINQLFEKPQITGE